VVLKAIPNLDAAVLVAETINRVIAQARRHHRREHRDDRGQSE
jgi:hypothetical protein